MVTASSKSSSNDKEDKKNRGNSPNGHASDEMDKEGEGGMRVGKAYQAEIPSIRSVSGENLPVPLNSELHPDMCPERALLVWAPNMNVKDMEMEEYLWLAKDKYGYNAEQALGMLFWHRHDLEKATRDLANFTPFPDEWTTEDKVLFEQAFQFHGKSFHRIRQMLPDKSISQLVKYYYLWKKTRQRSSLIDKHARKHAAKLEGSETNLSSGNADRSEDEDEPMKGEDVKICTNCTVPATKLSETPKGIQCLTCFNHWKKVGTLRPTVGPMKRDRQLIKHKRTPPRGMYINHEDLMAMVSPEPSNWNDPNNPGQAILKHMENEVIALKRQVQSNKASVSRIRSLISGNSIQQYRPSNPTIRLNAKWSNDELLLAVQGVRKFGRNFKAIAEIIGNKTENHVRSFFVTYRKRYNLDSILKEWEEEYGPFPDNGETENKETPNTVGSSTRGTPSKSH